MKALVADFSLGKEVWSRLKARVLSREDKPATLSLELAELPEPSLPSPRWVKIRTIMSGISDMDEGVFLHRNLAPYGPVLSFPFVPGNENLGIITEVGKDVKGIEPGERVVINPLLSCRVREVEPLCPSCRNGEPSACRNFGSGAIGPGVLIGACGGTGGGWGDTFVAHFSQVRAIPQEMDSDRALLIPEFTRAVRAVLAHPPVPADKVIIVGARPLGLLTFMALGVMSPCSEILVVAEGAHEADLARRLGAPSVVVSSGAGTAVEQVADFVKGAVRYPHVGSISLQGGADLVYETTGTSDNIEDALRFTGEGKDLVLMGINQPSGFDISPLWFKGVKIKGTAFSGIDSYNGEVTETIDIALDLTIKYGHALTELITHRFSPAEHGKAFAVLRDRSANQVIKVVFSHVM